MITTWGAFGPLTGAEASTMSRQEVGHDGSHLPLQEPLENAPRYLEEIEGRLNEHQDR